MCIMMFLPDPDNRYEWQILVWIASRFKGEWAVIIFLILLVLYGVYKLYEYILTRLYHLYREHAFADTASARVLQGSLACFAVLLLIAISLFTNGQPGAAINLGAVSFALFAVIVEVTAWHTERMKPAPQLPDNLSLQEVISWQATVDTAKQEPTS
jgi:hypothetical protein